MAVEWAQLRPQTKEPTDCFIIGLYFCIMVVVLEGEYVRGLMEREHPKTTKWIWQSDNVSSAALCQIVTEQPRFKEMAHTLHISMGECPKFQGKSFKMTTKFETKYEEPFFCSSYG